MTTFTPHDSTLDERTRKAWSAYREDLAELQGRAYDAAEAESWDRLQEQLAGHRGRPRRAPHRWRARRLNGLQHRPRWRQGARSARVRAGPPPRPHGWDRSGSRMRSQSPAQRRKPRQAAVAACALAAALTLASCGSDDSTRTNAERPPVPIVISAAINDDAVSVSPKQFGAGPIRLVISNQSTSSQQVTLETTDDPGGSGPGVKAIATGPISPRETASVKGEVKPGHLRVAGRRRRRPPRAHRGGQATPVRAERAAAALAGGAAHAPPCRHAPRPPPHGPARSPARGDRPRRLAGPVAQADPTPSQTVFTKKLLDDPKTSAGVKRMLTTKSAIVDPRSGFVDVTGDGRQDALILVSTGGAGGAVALYVFSTHGQATARPTTRRR